MSPSDWARLAETSADIVAFHHPAYRGVAESTRTIVGVHEQSVCVALAEGDVSSRARRARLVEAVANNGARCVVFSGFADGYGEVIRALSSTLPTLSIRVMWHGSPLQNVEDCNWNPLTEIVSLARQGLVERVGFLKRGMAEVVRRAGVKTYWLRNFVEGIPQQPGRTPDDGRLHIGIWDTGDSWRKNPHAMLSAVALVDKALVSGVLGDRAREWCEIVGIPLDRVERSALGHTELLHRLGGMHCNLYVTLSECSPLLPLECLSQGAPCLVSATSHLFEESEVLSETLIVRRFDDPQAIAGAVRVACERRGEIVAAYRDYAPDYNARAREAARNFLSDT